MFQSDIVCLFGNHLVIVHCVSPLPPSPSFMKLSYCTVTVWTICLRMTSFTFKKHLFLFRLLNHNPFAFGGNIHKN